MSQNSFKFINSPHTPLTISGSDPYAGRSNANLSVWFKLDSEKRDYLTGSTTDGDGRNYVDSLFDQSLNGGGRDLNRGAGSIPVLSDDTVAGHKYIEGTSNITGRPIYMRTSNATGSGTNLGGQTATWIHGPTTDNNNALPQSTFLMMKHASTAAQYGQPFTITYGTRYPNDDGNDGERAPLSFGLERHQTPGTMHVRVGGVYGQQLISEPLNSMKNNFHCLSLVYHTGSTISELKTYRGGKLDYHQPTSGTYGFNSSILPDHNGALKYMAIGGDGTSWGAGYAANKNENGIAEIFVFEDALSDTRRQQMEAYLTDKYDLALSSSERLSTFVGKAEGIPELTSSIGAITGLTDTVASRKYTVKKSDANDFHHETVAGAFVRSSHSGSALYAVTSSTEITSSIGISTRAWVRAENLDDSNHAGSHVALMTKATDPHGHQMDNLKGYALKFGTFKDGADTSSLKFRLSKRDARETTDGTAAGFGDVDLTPSFTPAAGNWYQMRLDVNRSGSVTKARDTSYESRTANVININHDQGALLAGSGSAWENLFGASSATEGAQTWSVWVKTSGFTNYYPQLMMIGDHSDPEHGIQMESPGKIYWSSHYDFSRRLWAWNNVFTSGLQDGTWRHILITSKMASTGADCITPELWFDGVKQTLTTNADPSNAASIMEFDDDNWSGDGNLIIGNNTSESESAYPTRFGDAAIWNKILTDSEIADVYNSGRLTTTSTSAVASSNLVAHYKMVGAGSPLTVQDETSNDNDLVANHATRVESVSDDGLFTDLQYPALDATTEAADIIKSYVRDSNASDWELINTTTVQSSANNFRYWKQDNGFDTTRVSGVNGIHNGYYIAVSSSNGQRVSTTYYIDNLQILTSGSTT